jgi:chaperone modulatory protein CbpM
VTSQLARPLRLDLKSFSDTTGLHPDLVVRFVELGLLEVEVSGDRQLRFAPTQVARAFRIQRLRSGLSLNYAAVGLVMDLLDRIDQLEGALRLRPTAPRRN